MIVSNQFEANILEIVRDPLESMGYGVVRIRIFSDRGKILQLMIERLDENHITLEDCEKASNYLSVVLDVENVLDERYSLELSSAGLDRPLTREKDFVLNKGKKVRIQSKTPINAQRKFSGTLIDFQEGKAIVDVVGRGVVEIPFINMIDATLDYFGSEDVQKNKKSKRSKIA